ncbi:hypothetical protein BJ986_002506 [Phycicoccus badiiscoriae]|uniref:Uncharacterized protein n=1 Tax=Pedococcus badiiscoriae TaxID=642776 RepID=A0A852WGX5_9MICO|nr:hypothetical protein [Pedococcus badiiscoriae]NYG08019.1 hypothetical protein [Pedococcus badiiscoriae]
MDFTSFHKLRTAVQENAHPADDRAAAKLRHSLETAVAASGLFSEVEFGHTDDAGQMVIGVCRCADGVLPWEAGMGVERLWLTATADLRWECHTVGCTDSLMELEGAVTIDESGHYITVHVVAEPAVVSRVSLVAQDGRRDEAAETAGIQAEPARLSVPG